MRLLSSAALVSSLLLAGACTGSAIIGGVDGPGGAADDDDAVADDDDAAGDDDDAVQTNPFEGDQEFFVMLIGNFGEGEEAFCEGFLEMEIDAEGAFTGEGECAMNWGGGNSGFDFEASGVVDMDGDVTEGLMRTAFSRGNAEWRESDLEGSVDESTGEEGSLYWVGDVELGWGDPIAYEGLAFVE